MIKFSILSLFIIIAQVKIFGQDSKCQKFKEGLFKIEADSKAPETQILRKGNLQVENISNKEGYSEFIIDWIDECTYTLTPTKKTFKRYPDLPKNAVLTVRIIEVKENSYIQTSSSNFADYKLTTEVIRVK